MIGSAITPEAVSGVYGHVDAIDADGIRGWILDLDSGINVVEVRINGIVVAESKATLPRPDIDNIVGKTTNCGFFIPWKEIKIPVDIINVKKFKIGFYHKRTKEEISISKRFLDEQQASFKKCIKGLDESFMLYIDNRNVNREDVIDMNIKLLKFKDLKIGKALVYFAHYDKDGIIDDCIKSYILGLKRFGYDIVIVSTADLKLDNETKRFLEENSNLLIIRDNIGYDFYSYKIAYLFTRVYLELYDVFILLNDSVYLISISLLHEFLNKIHFNINQSDFDCIGALSSCEKTYHLQSWFLAFKVSPSLISFMDSFFRDMVVEQDKGKLIDFYEIGLSQKLLSKGFKIGAIYEYNDLSSKIDYTHPYYKYLHGFYRNPSHFFWDILISNDFPFIKKDLLVKNPSGVINIDKWKNLCSAKGDEKLIEQIEKNISRLKSRT